MNQDADDPIVELLLKLDLAQRCAVSEFSHDALCTLAKVVNDLGYQDAARLKLYKVDHKVLIVWMAKGGANSGLWKWLPPLWPWGHVAKSAWARWTLVSFLVAGTLAGIVAELTSPLPPH